MNHIGTSLRALAVFTLLTGIIYTASLMAIGQLLYPVQARGSLIEKNGKIIGSQLIAQKSKSESFQPRPSTADFATVASGASNLGPTSAALKELVDKRRAEWGAEAPAELLFASGSGLDPHLSPAGAQFQIAKVAKARGFNQAQTARLTEAVTKMVEGPTFGFLGASRVNVLNLNLVLEEMK